MIASFWLVDVFNALPWYAWVAIAGIGGGIITKVVAMSHRHRERLEMIRHGINPGPNIETDD